MLLVVFFLAAGCQAGDLGAWFFGAKEPNRGVGVVGADGSGQMGPGTAHPAAASPERRLALVIGNGRYASGPLKNSTNDAVDVTARLQSLGFTVTHKENVNLRTMDESIRAFGRDLKKGGVGLFYYSGHGLQVGGVNYLVPVDARVEKEADVRFECLDTNRVMAEMEEARNGLNLIILDACRDNPFASWYRSGANGLAQMDAPTGTFIAFATAPGSVAADGTGRNGIFTKHFLENMNQPGLVIDKVMQNVRNGVMAETGNKQVPWQASSLTKDFFFVSSILPSSALAASPSAATAPAAPVASPPPPAPGPTGTVPDLTQTIKQREEEEKEWAGWQKKLEAEFAKAKAYEANTKLKPIEKQDVWDTFLRAFNQDNPYSTQDDDLRKRAKQRLGYWETQDPASLGLAYFFGSNGEQDYGKAMIWLRKAADQGDVLSMNMIGAMYRDGTGVSVDYQQAMVWFKNAANLGSAEGMYLVSDLYDSGRGVPKDYQTAVLWLRKSAEGGYPAAMTALGAHYGFGAGVPKDASQAFDWFLKAAEKGDVEAMGFVGICYRDGDGVALNSNQALYWLRKAADKGNGDAMFHLGFCYDLGKGVPRDRSQAVSWYRQAAAKGVESAQERLKELGY